MDPVFLVGGAPTLQGALTYKFARFAQKMHEIKKFLVRKGWVGHFPLGSAPGNVSLIIENR